MFEMVVMLYYKSERQEDTVLEATGWRRHWRRSTWDSRQPWRVVCAEWSWTATVPPSRERHSSDCRRSSAQTPADKPIG